MPTKKPIPTKKPTSKFPSQIIVFKDTQDGEEYLLVADGIDAVGDNTIVGIYDLREIKRTMVTTGLVPV